MGKIILMDTAMYLHRAAFGHHHNPNIPINYTILNMLVANLRKIGIAGDDVVILALEGGNNWRKKFSQEYKANRKGLKASSGLGWERIYKDFDELLGKLDQGTEWVILKVENCEADDLASVACRYYHDKEMVLVSFDEDWTQLWEYPNVKIFSPLVKYRSTKGAYKIRPDGFNAYKLIAKKIRKETSDNLISEILSEDDYDLRMMLVNLLELPEEIESKCRAAFDSITPKVNINPEMIPFQTLRTKIANLIGDTTAIITYEDCVAWNAKKQLKKKRSKK